MSINLIQKRYTIPTLFLFRTKETLTSSLDYEILYDLAYYFKAFDKTVFILYFFFSVCVYIQFFFMGEGSKGALPLPNKNFEIFFRKHRVYKFPLINFNK